MHVLTVNPSERATLATSEFAHTLLKILVLVLVIHYDLKVTIVAQHPDIEIIPRKA